jgi:ferredoxin
MAKYKVLVDQDLCIGCGACVSACDNFQMVDGKSQPKKAEVSEVGCNEEAAGICPVEAIKVTKVK